jgi:hypothetical protein
MLDRERLSLAISIQSQSHKLLQWVGKSIASGQVPIMRAQHHSDDPEAAYEWLQHDRLLLPDAVRPGEANLREFANFFRTYLVTSYDVIAQPGTRLQSSFGCYCSLCARIVNANHLRPKKLTPADKRRAAELMSERVAELSREQNFAVSPNRCVALVDDPTTRRLAAFSAYGKWLINRLSGQTDGPAVLALWREIAWAPAGSPIRGFTLRLKDFEQAELLLAQSLCGDIGGVAPSTKNAGVLGEEPKKPAG